VEEPGGLRCRAGPLSRGLPLGLFSALLVACESAAPQPEPIDPESAGLGIALAMTETLGPLRKDTVQPEIVLFVRLEPGDELERLSEARVLIPSTFVRGDYAYLLNAIPGRYVAVAALHGGTWDRPR